MKDWPKNYRPVRLRTVRSETTKDKVGTLPPAMYSNVNPNYVAVYLLHSLCSNYDGLFSAINDLVSDAYRK